MSDAPDAIDTLTRVCNALGARIEALETKVRDNGEAVDTTLGNIDIVTQALEALAVQVRELRAHVHTEIVLATEEELKAAYFAPKDNGDNAPPGFRDGD